MFVNLTKIFQQTVNLGNEKLKSISNLKLGVITCGGFFITIVNIIKQNANKSYVEIFKDESTRKNGYVFN